MRVSYRSNCSGVPGDDNINYSSQKKQPKENEGFDESFLDILTEDILGEWQECDDSIKNKNSLSINNRPQ